MQKIYVLKTQINVQEVKVYNYLINFFFQVWFQNRRAKFRKQERLAQQKSSNINSDSPNPTTNIKAENNSSTKNSISSNKDNVKPGSPHSSISTTPNSNTSSISSLHSNNGDIKPSNGHSGKLNIEKLVIALKAHCPLRLFLYSKITYSFQIMPLFENMFLEKKISSKIP